MNLPVNLFTEGYAMTAQLSRERLEEIASWEIENTDAGTRHAPGAHSRVYSYEIVEMARMLLSGMDSEPVHQLFDSGYYDTDRETYQNATQAGVKGRILYAATPAPVAVPDVGEFRIFTQTGGVKVAVKDGKTKNHLFGMGWNACRAAMLKAGPVTEATVPDGWKIVPVDPTKDMLRAGQSVVGFWLNTVHCYSKMLAAAPAAPEQEV